MRAMRYRDGDYHECQDVQGCNDARGDGRGGWQQVHGQLLLCLLVQRVLICLFVQHDSNCMNVSFF